MWFKRKGNARGADRVDQAWYPDAATLPVVQVRYCEDGLPSRDTWGYLWGLSRKPKVGDWVIVPAGEGTKVGLVEGLGAEGYDGPFKKVHRLATLLEVRQAMNE